MNEPKTKLVKIPNTVALAIAQYYFNRDKQVYVGYAHSVPGVQFASGTHYVAVPTNYQWDKEADNRAVEAAALKAGYTSIAASSGSFWLSNSKKHRIHYVSEKTWPLAESKPTIRNPRAEQG